MSNTCGGTFQQSIDCSAQPLDLSFHPNREYVMAAALADGTIESEQNKKCVCVCVFSDFYYLPVVRANTNESEIELTHNTQQRNHALSSYYSSRPSFQRSN